MTWNKRATRPNLPGHPRSKSGHSWKHWNPHLRPDVLRFNASNLSGQIHQKKFAIHQMHKWLTFMFSWCPCLTVSQCASDILKTTYQKTSQLWLKPSGALFFFQWKIKTTPTIPGLTSPPTSTRLPTFSRSIASGHFSVQNVKDMRVKDNISFLEIFKKNSS